MSNLTDYDRKILRHINGEDFPDLSWGAAMGAALGFLHESGYVIGTNPVRITKDGLEELKK